MSIKPIEVQGSFPQSQKTGKLQEQMQQRGQVSQEIIGQQLEAEDRLKRKQVTKTQESEKSKLQKERDQSNKDKKKKNNENDHNQKGANNQSDEVEPNNSHPYKGKFIDFSG
ncbi:hypothetical protein [Alkalihalophilus marmarensis]|uniref:hypothetical protein n=1 Tax=Alkalihalophilus marmarensis TaxID=521377 RepID=UPI002DBB2136|nr:hypothetical protein [Alkalihalophilus marmarensis]MEC2073131.1 hypothetical protein [Alkalihalophilus marmarensis]